MPSFDVVIKAPAEPRATPLNEVRLIFPPLRTRFKTAQQQAGDLLAGVEISAPTSVLVWLGWAAALAPNESITVTLDYEGEPPVTAPKQDFSGESLQGDVLLLAEPLDAQRLAERRDEKILEETQQVLREFVGRRRDFIASVKDPRLRHSLEFFEAYDRATSPPFLEESNRGLAKTIEDAMKVLRRRISKRALGDSLEARDVISDNILNRLSTIQFEVFQDYFGTKQSPIDINVNTFEDSFIAFSTGQLEQRPAEETWNGKPDSAHFFSFAEFAIHAIRSGVHTVAWTELLPVFVMCQELYALVYKPYCGPWNEPRYVKKEQRTFQMWSGLHSPTPQDIQNRIWDVKESFRRLGLRSLDEFIDRHAANARVAFQKGDATPHDPCRAGPHAFLTETTMADDHLKRLLEAVTQYVSEYLRTYDGNWDDNKYVHIDLQTLQGEVTGPPEDGTAADKGERNVNDGRAILGPLTAILNASSRAGWPDCPTFQMHIDANGLTIIGEKEEKTTWWSYPNSHYKTFIIVVNK